MALLAYNYAPLKTFYNPGDVFETASDKIIYTLKWHGLSVAVLFYMIESVAHEREAKAWNPLDHANQGNTVALNKILTNTLEQFALFTTSTLVLSIYLEPGQMKMIPILVCLWVIGRILFSEGYKIDPIYRSPGFAMSFLPSLFSLTALAYFQVMQGPWILSIFSAAFALRRFKSVLNFFGRSR